VVQNLLSFCLLSKNKDLNESIIFTDVLYRCETWSRILRQEHRSRVYENRKLRGIFGSKREEATGGWRKLHNEELHGL
jgi:hypothetical protein